MGRISIVNEILTMENTLKNKNMIHPLTAKSILMFLMPHSLLEWVMSIIDTSALGVCILINNGFLHQFNEGLESVIKLLTAISLLLTIIVKLRKKTKS